MEPRFESVAYDGSRLVGGCERFDLHVDRDGDVALIWGNGTSEWGLLDGRAALRPRLLYLPLRLAVEEGKRNPPTRDELTLIERFLRIFAPDVKFNESNDNTLTMEK